MRKIIIFSLILVALAGCSGQSNRPIDDNHQTAPSSASSLATNSLASTSTIKEQQNWQTYTDSFSDIKVISFRHPSDWQVDASKHILHFTVNGKQYHFGYYRGGEIVADSHQNSGGKYGGTLFLKTTFFRQESPFLVVYMPSDISFDEYDGIQGEVPPENSDSYISRVYWKYSRQQFLQKVDANDRLRLAAIAYEVE